MRVVTGYRYRLRALGAVLSMVAVLGAAMLFGQTYIAYEGQQAFLHRAATELVQDYARELLSSVTRTDRVAALEVLTPLRDSTKVVSAEVRFDATERQRVLGSGDPRAAFTVSAPIELSTALVSAARAAQPGAPELRLVYSSAELTEFLSNRIVQAVCKVLALTLLVAVVVVRRMLKPMRETMDALAAISVGDFTLDAPGLERSDAVGEFSRTVENFRRRGWELSDLREKLESQVLAQTQQLRKAKEAAEEALKVKSELLACMRHEIRTSVNGVICMNELFLDTRLDPPQREYAQIVGRSGRALLSIVNDILDSSKLASSHMSFEREASN